FVLYLYDDVEDLTKTSGVGGTAGFSAGNASHIPHDNDQTRYHEMVHIVAYNLLPRSGSEKRNLFFAEGLANACLEFVHGVPVHAVASFYRTKGVLPELGEMLHTEDFYAWLGARPGFNAYDVGGSLFRFLLDHHGAARTTRYYTGASARKAFGVSEKKIEKKWHEALDRFTMRPALMKLLEERHGASVRMLEARNAPAGLPAAILGKPRDWKSLMKARLIPQNSAKWLRRGKSIIGASSEAVWSVCELGEKSYGDCVVRARIKTEKSTPIQVRLGEGNQGMLVNGTFLYRGEKPVAHSPLASMSSLRKTTDFVLVRSAGKIEIWIDGRKALSTSADSSPARVGIAFHQGRVVFEEVRVRELR
ncbi:MAG: hypothetical protein ACE5F1_21905, partial [Planctomycetota bacterium]